MRQAEWACSACHSVSPQNALARLQLAGRTGFPQHAPWYWETGERPGLYDIRLLLRIADVAPLRALLPVILGQPPALAVTQVTSLPWAQAEVAAYG